MTVINPEHPQNYESHIQLLKAKPISPRRISNPKSSRPKIPEGWYKAKIIGYQTAPFIKQGKLMLYFEIFEGDYSGITVFMAFEVILTGPPGVNGRFELKGPRSKLSKFLYGFNETSLDDDLPSIDELARTNWNILIKNPEYDYEGEFIPEDLRYSKVEIAIPQR